ncbi:hypothetical protein LEP1GSC170_0972 [Leptospira interrogans serovar Bataviae str. HAI135]|nr:hypothetical protein LEP1GSC170_0972 [Leptospira interrogans serovar Bataviae str. HAI135]
MFLAKSDSLISAIPPESVPIVIVLVSIIGFTIIIERLIYFSKWKPISQDDWRSLKELFRQRNWNTAIDFLKGMKSGPSILVLQAGIESSLKNLEAAEEEMLSAGFAQILKNGKISFRTRYDCNYFSSFGSFGNCTWNYSFF